MNKMTNLFLSTLVCLVLISCNNEEPLFHNVVIETASASHRVSLAKALNNAEILFEGMNDYKTKSLRVPSKIDYILQSKTKGISDTDTLLYVINYADDNGFAICAADDRLPSVYAISDHGNIDLENTSNNEPLNDWIQYMYFDINHSLTNNNNSKTRGLGIDEPEDPNLGDRKVTYYTREYPQLDLYPSRWSQGYPFNDYMPFLDSENQALVGCGPLACVQIMSYYMWPETFENKTINWNDINYPDSLTGAYGVPYCSSTLKWLLFRTGQILGAIYTNKGTGISTYSIRDNFDKFGYKKLNAPKIFTNSAAKSDILNGPLLLIGANKYNQEEAHAWIMDGCLIYLEEWDAIANEDHKLLYQLNHYVWGWGGTHNGYFLWRDNNEIGGYPNFYADSDNGANEEKYNITFNNIVYYSDFTPNK